MIGRNDSKWSPYDYIVNGEYCNAPPILEQLQCIRKHTHAECVVLLVCQDKTFFQNLFLVAHRYKIKETELQSNLTKSVITKWGLGDSIKEFFFNNKSCEVKFVIDRFNFEPIKSLFKYLPHNRILTVSNQFCSSIINNDPIPLFSLSLIVLFIHNEKVNIDSDLKLNKLFMKLNCMVNANALIAVNKRIRTSTFIEKKIVDIQENVSRHEKKYYTVSDIHEFDSDLIQYAHGLLTAATVLTHSKIGNIYMPSKNGKTLHLVAAIGNEKPVLIIDTEKTNSVVASVYRTKKPRLINDVKQLINDMDTKLQYIWVGSEEESASAELAIPIFQRNPESGTQTVLGVLNVEKVSNINLGNYSAIDVDSLQQIAMHFCLYRSSRRLARSVDSLTSLTKKSFSLSSNQLRIYERGDTLEKSIPLEATLIKEQVDSSMKCNTAG